MQIGVFRRKKIRKAASILSYIILIAMVAGLSIGLGILFATFGRIETELSNANMTIPAEFSNNIDTAQNFAGVGLLIALSIAIVGLAMVLVYTIGGAFRSAGE